MTIQQLLDWLNAHPILTVQELRDVSASIGFQQPAVANTNQLRSNLNNYLNSGNPADQVQFVDLNLAPVGLRQAVQIQAAAQPAAPAPPAQAPAAPQPAVQPQVQAQQPALTITTTSPLPGATVGTAYNQQLQATGGTAPYTWASPNRPDWMGLDSTTGAMTGTPLMLHAGHRTLMVTVTDNTGQVTRKQFTIDVAQPARAAHGGQPVHGQQANQPADNRGAMILAGIAIALVLLLALASLGAFTGFIPTRVVAQGPTNVVTNDQLAAVEKVANEARTTANEARTAAEAAQKTGQEINGKLDQLITTAKETESKVTGAVDKMGNRIEAVEKVAKEALDEAKKARPAAPSTSATPGTITGTGQVTQPGSSSDPLVSHWQRLEQLDGNFRSQGWENWLKSAGVTWDGNQIEARQIEEETSPASRIFASGIQVRGKNIQVNWPVVVTTDRPNEIAETANTVKHQPDMRNPSVLYTNVVLNGQGTIWISGYSWGQFSSKLGFLQQATQPAQSASPTVTTAPATTTEPDQAQVPAKPQSFCLSEAELNAKYGIVRNAQGASNGLLLENGKFAGAVIRLNAQQAEELTRGGWTIQGGNPTIKSAWSPTSCR